MQNTDIRNEVQAAGLKLWQIAHGHTRQAIAEVYRGLASLWRGDCFG